MASSMTAINSSSNEMVHERSSSMQTDIWDQNWVGECVMEGRIGREEVPMTIAVLPPGLSFFFFFFSFLRSLDFSLFSFSLPYAR